MIDKEGNAGTENGIVGTEKESDGIGRFGNVGEVKELLGADGNT